MCLSIALLRRGQGLGARPGESCFSYTDFQLGAEVFQKQVFQDRILLVKSLLCEPKTSLLVCNISVYTGSVVIRE